MRFQRKPTQLIRTLVWWWVVRPDLGAAIALEAPQKLKNIISQYILQNLQQFRMKQHSKHRRRPIALYPFQPPNPQKGN
ncbi:hypothetical protein [Microcoleus sp. OTE_8_concoct_300]|uniref:hypothetical protein n=1 Tax=Microcoleus sp. OTE_8_concoct_300 TaxID=2964710 RepID=UPI00403F2B89